MAKKAMLTTNATYHKTKKGFLTTEGTYHKVKKAYKTVGGAYRPCWSTGEVSYYGYVTPLNNKVNYVKGASLKDANGKDKFAVFVGGDTGTGSGSARYSLAVEAYNSIRTKIDTGVSLSTSRQRVGIVSHGNLVYIAGGDRGSGTLTNEVCTITESFTRTTLSNLSQRLTDLSGDSAGGKVVFGGGFTESGNYTWYPEVYDGGTRIASGLPKFSKQCGHRAATSKGGKVIFGGGIDGNGNRLTAVDAIDESLTMYTTVAPLSEARAYLSAEEVGEFVLFAGGKPKSGYSSVVDIYDSSLTKIEIVSITLSEARQEMASTMANNVAMFFGGYGANITSASVDAIDENLTHTTPVKMAHARCYHDAATAGDSVIVCGGTSAGDTAEAYVC